MADHTFRPEIEVLSAADVPHRRPWSDADTIWRRQYRSGELGDETSPTFIPLTLPPKASTLMPAAAPIAPYTPRDARLENVLRNGRRLLVPSSVDPEELVRLIPVMEGR